MQNITTTAERLINGGNSIFDHALTIDQYDHRAALAAAGAWIRQQAGSTCKSSKDVQVGLMDDGVLYTFEDGSRLLMVRDLATCNANDIEAAE